MPSELKPSFKHAYSKSNLKKKIEAAMNDFVRSGGVVDRPQRTSTLTPPVSCCPNAKHPQ
jgi:hypothetical protein